MRFLLCPSLVASVLLSFSTQADILESVRAKLKDPEPLVTKVIDSLFHQEKALLVWKDLDDQLAIAFDQSGSASKREDLEDRVFRDIRDQYEPQLKLKIRRFLKESLRGFILSLGEVKWIEPFPKVPFSEEVVHYYLGESQIQTSILDVPVVGTSLGYAGKEGLCFSRSSPSRRVSADLNPIVTSLEPWGLSGQIKWRPSFSLEEDSPHSQLLWELFGLERFVLIQDDLPPIRRDLVLVHEIRHAIDSIELGSVAHTFFEIEKPGLLWIFQTKTLGQIVLDYRVYSKALKARGEEPISFQAFVEKSEKEYLYFHRRSERLAYQEEIRFLMSKSGGNRTRFESLFRALGKEPEFSRIGVENRFFEKLIRDTIQESIDQK